MTEGGASGPLGASAGPRWPDNRASRLFGVRYPLVQTGMGWVSGASLTAATAAAGGLGILASATMTVAELRTAIAKVRDRTEAPFGVNVLPSQADLDDRVALLESARIPVASFAGAPSADVVRRLRDSGITTIVTVGAKRHAEKMAGLGVSALIAQGGEGGGHTGPIATSLLLPAVVDAVAGSEVVVLGAGGFHDGRGLVAAMAYGADGIAMGTRFLLTKESQVPDHVKDVYLAATPTSTVVTSAIDGSPQRVIRTEVIDGIESSMAPVRLARAVGNALRFRSLTGTGLAALVRTGIAMRRDQDLTWAQLAMAANAPMLTRAAMVEGHLDVGILPTGQVTGSIDELPTVAELIDRIMTEADATLARLGGL